MGFSLGIAIGLLVTSLHGHSGAQGMTLLQ